MLSDARRRLAGRLAGLEYLQAEVRRLLTEHSGVTGTVTSPAADVLGEAVARAYTVLDDGQPRDLYPSEAATRRHAARES